MGAGLPVAGVHRDRLFMQPTGKDGGLPPPAIKYTERKKRLATQTENKPARGNRRLRNAGKHYEGKI